MNTWKPIETAPKDGTRILLYGNKLTFCGRWFDKEEIEEWENPEDLDEGWYEENLFHQCYETYCFKVDPTYWQPLPEPPEEK